MRVPLRCGLPVRLLPGLPRSFAVLLAAAALLPAQVVVHVDAAASGANDGTSWADAFQSLQAALQAAPVGGAGVEVWVAAGTYAPGVLGDRSATFALRNNLALYGGFAGGEAARWRRDPAANRTVLTGDLDHDDAIPGGSGWYNSAGSYLGNSCHVVTADAVDATAVIDGFTVEGGASGLGGSASGSGGAGVRATQASPTIANCHFRHNYAVGGGALFASGGGPVVRDCRFEENLSFASHGGGIYMDGVAAAVVERCAFDGNVALENGGPPSAGGAVYLGFDSVNVRIVDSTFTGNQSIFRFAGPGGIYPMIGGGLFNGGQDTRVERCTFRANRTQQGGGICSFRPMTVLDSVFDHNLVFSSTNGGGWGGGIAIAEYQLTATTSTIRGCTLIDNSASDEGGGVWIGGPVTCRPENCILRGNTDVEGNGNRSQSRGGRPRWSNISGFLFAPPGEDPIDPAEFPGCYDLPPQFVDRDGSDNIAGTADDDLRLLSTSPCIDRGNPATGGGGVDAAGMPRRLDGDLDGGQRVDTGAHEFGHVRLLVGV
ncbi:MAG: right-handed parallel beta-helix repeat-containing protein, partial [Planctomycetota bacterium]